MNRHHHGRSFGNSSTGSFLRVASLFLLAILLMALSGASALASPKAAAPNVSLLVKFKASATAADVTGAIAAGGGRSVREFQQIRTRVVSVPAATVDKVLVAFARHPSVERAAKAVTMKKASIPDDPGYVQQWALPRIGWDYGTASGAARIAVLDTGVDASHPYLSAVVGSGYSAFAGGNAGSDPNGHGTAVAGIAAATTNNAAGIAGVAHSGATVLPVQVLGADGTGTDADVIAGVLWAADNGASVMLMAFSSPDYSAALADALAYAWGKGAVLVAATGNDGSTAPSYPAGMPNVLGVAATDQADALGANSNTGSALVAAPGVDIYTTRPGGSYGNLTGTSAASAMVAGEAALLVAGGKGNAYVFDQVRGAVDPISGAPFGRINLATALGGDVSAPPAPAPGPTPAPGTPPVYTGGAAFFTIYGTVEGQLLGGGYAPIAGALVEVYVAGYRCGRTYTNASGYYEITSCRFGWDTFTATAYASGYYSASSSFYHNWPSEEPEWFRLTRIPIIPTVTGQTLTTMEDTAIPITLSGSDVDSGSLTFSILTPPSIGTLGTISDPTCVSDGAYGSSCTASVTYTPNPNFTGSDSFVLRAHDRNGFSNGGTVSITVTNVNDAPVLHRDRDPTMSAINEDIALESNTGNAVSAITNFPGYITDVDGIHNVALNRPAYASSIVNWWEYPASKAVDGRMDTRWSSSYGGDQQSNDDQWIKVDLGQSYYIVGVTLKWEAYAAAYEIQVSEDDDTWTTIHSTSSGDGGTDVITGLSATARYVKMKGIHRYYQNAGYSLWEFEVYGSAPPKGLAVTAVDNTNGAWWYSTNNGSDWSLIADGSEDSALLLTPDARVRFAPNQNYFGSATMTVRAWDQTSGTAGDKLGTRTNGESTAFSADSDAVSITVNAVNDAPSFTKGVDVTVDENSGPYSAAWATGISAGPANEPDQTVSFLFDSNSNSALFSSGPAVASDGTLTFTPSANGFGSAIIGVKAQDNGGTANGGVDSSGVQTFTITVDAANRAPIIGDQSLYVPENSANGTLVGTIVATDPDAGQTLTYAITSDDSGGAFSISNESATRDQLTVATSAALDFETNLSHSFSLTVQVSDDGSPAMSSSATITVNVTDVNEAPVLTPSLVFRTWAI